MTTPEPQPIHVDPTASIQQALDRAREHRRQTGHAPAIVLEAGRYFIDQTIELTCEDGGSADEPLVITGAPGADVRLIGGRAIDDFTPVDDPAILDRLAPETRGHVVAAHLPTLGINDFGRYEPRGHGGGSAHAPLELFADARPMSVARWPKASPLPNHGYEPVADVDRDHIVYESNRPGRWRPSDQLHARGYFALDWASNIVRITELDASNKRIAVDPPRAGHYGLRKGGRFYFFNILEEITGPGDWFLDRHTGVLYFWPPQPIDECEVVASTLDGPVLSLREAEHVRIERLTIEMMRGDGVTIEGGRDVTLAGCTLRNIGRDAVRIGGGFDHAVLSCDVHDTGECGVAIDAGDRATLTPCNHRVHNCHLHHIAREGWTYFGAIMLDGCGVIASHNRIHDHPHALAFYRGNDHLVEYNEWYNSTLEGDDCGMMYTGRRFDWQGHVVRHNFFHHAGDSGRNEWGSSGVYMDDGAGGTEIHGNVFQLVNKAILAGGGINTRVHHNVFVDCHPAFWFDERCASALAERGETMIHGWMKDHFYQVSAHEPPYSERYPLMDMVHQQLQKGQGIRAKGSCATHNLTLDCGGPDWLYTDWPTPPDYFECHDNLVEMDPGFADRAMGDFRVAADSPALAKIGAEPIPFERIGLLRDEYRTALEDVTAAIEIVEPVAGDGAAGRGRLVLHNRGDVPVSGIELIEIKLQRHGPGITHVQVPFNVEPGQREAFDFDVEVPADELRGRYELHLHSRGERVRPAWTMMPVAFTLDTSLSTLTPIVAGGEPSRVQLAVRNVGRERAAGTVTIHAEPGAARLQGSQAPAAIDVDLPPGDQHTAPVELALDPAAAPTISRVQLAAAGPDVRPATLDALVEHPLPDLNVETADQLLAALTDAPAFPVARAPLRATGAHIADLRLAFAGPRLAILADVRDARVVVTDLKWDGSSIELFATSPDRERIGHVFGNIEIGHVYLTPTDASHPAAAFAVQGNDDLPAPDIDIHCRPTDDGYQLAALVPLGRLAIADDADEMLFEAQITTGFGEGITQHRANIFGSKTAFLESDVFGLLTRTG